MQIIDKYFPDLDADKREKLSRLKDLYTEWNERINVISRKDIDSIYEHHVLHSLAIAKVIEFTPGTKILDIGTGGGFPGIPLAIMFPEVEFFLVDSIQKKIKVVNAIAEELNLTNVKAEQARAEKLKMKFDFIVSRAVTNLPDFMNLVKGKIQNRRNNDIANGILYLKGGDISEELKVVKRKNKIYNISEYFDEPFFETKFVLHLY